MKKFIKKVFNNEDITITDLNEFIVDYCKLCQVKDPSANEINIISQLIQNGSFNLIFACKNAAVKLGMDVYEIKDKNGIIIGYKINE